MNAGITTVIAITIASLASARADSVGGRPDERNSIQHAESVVVGSFTGVTSRRVLDQRNAIDASGRAYTARIEFAAHEFAVAEQLDGAPTPAKISILVPGALALPAPRRRVVIGIRAEGTAPEDGYNLMYGRTLEADTDARLAELRTWVMDVRAPVPVDPQAIAEAVGLHEAEVRPDEPEAGQPIGHDDPDGPARVRFIGAPGTAPRVIEPLGDPRHPPEPPEPRAAVASPEAAEPTPRIAPTPRGTVRAPASIGVAREPREAKPGSRWPFVAAATLALAAAVLWRRRHAAPARSR